VEIRQHHTYVATVRIRRGPGWDVKPEAEALDGRRMRFLASWCNGEDERYAGEWAMMPVERVPWIAWVASGDLVDITEERGDG
jgi:hypothetical protein